MSQHRCEHEELQHTSAVSSHVPLEKPTNWPPLGGEGRSEPPEKGKAFVSNQKKQKEPQSSWKKQHLQIQDFVNQHETVYTIYIYIYTLSVQDRC